MPNQIQTSPASMAPLFQNVQLSGNRQGAMPVPNQQSQPAQSQPSQGNPVDQQLVQLLHSNPQLADMLSQNPQLVQQIESNPQMLSQLTSHMQQGGQSQLPAGLSQANPQTLVGPDSGVASNSVHSQTAQGHSIKQVLDQALNTSEGQQIQQEMKDKFPEMFSSQSSKQDSK